MANVRVLKPVQPGSGGVLQSPGCSRLSGGRLQRVGASADGGDGAGTAQRASEPWRRPPSALQRPCNVTGGTAAPAICRLHSCMCLRPCPPNRRLGRRIERCFHVSDVHPPHIHHPARGQRGRRRGWRRRTAARPHDLAAGQAPQPGRQRASRQPATPAAPLQRRRNHGGGPRGAWTLVARAVVVGAAARRRSASASMHTVGSV